MTRTIIIIGGGPAGVEAALAAQRPGTDVTLISDGPLGGRAGWHSLLPSKVWLSAAADNSLTKDPEGFSKWQNIQDQAPVEIVDRISQVKQVWNASLESTLEYKDVNIIQGTASFISDSEVEVRASEDEDLTILTADSFIVASGSIPIFPQNLKPDGDKVIAPRFASHLSKLPQSMIVVGAGATGSESAYLFNQFGVDVIWIVDQFGILPQMNPDLGCALGNALSEQGVRVIQGQMVDRLERGAGVTAVLADESRYHADMAFVAVGRKPELGRINMAGAGLSPEPDGQIKTDGYGRTDNMKVYLVGDAAGGAMVANKAMAQARIAGLHAAGLSVSPFNAELIVHVAYTEPQAAQVGDTQLADGVKSVRIPFSSALKAHLIDAKEGFIELFYNESDRRLRGAVAFGSHAADILTPLVVALHLHATIEQMAEIYGPHPTFSELPFIIARAV